MSNHAAIVCFNSLLLGFKQTMGYVLGELWDTSEQTMGYNTEYLNGVHFEWTMGYNWMNYGI